MQLDLVHMAAVLVGAATPADRADRAEHEFEAHRYAAAFEGFAALADEGDAHAARMALLMSDHGARLCGRQFPVDAARHGRWLATSTADASAPA